MWLTLNVLYKHRPFLFYFNGYTMASPCEQSVNDRFLPATLSNKTSFDDSLFHKFGSLKNYTIFSKRQKLCLHPKINFLRALNHFFLYKVDTVRLFSLRANYPCRQNYIASVLVDKFIAESNTANSLKKSAKRM